LTEKETIEKVKQKQGILSQIQNFFTLGYGTKEDLRELDKKLRDMYYEELRNMRHLWEDIYLAALNSKISDSKSDFKKIIQVLDRVMENVRHADYGYSGLMDRKGHIREEELARVFNYDRDLGQSIEKMLDAVRKAQNETESENWTSLKTEVKDIKALLLGFENNWREREAQFRPLKI
jgi:predicted helicase